MIGTTSLFQIACSESLPEVKYLVPYIPNELFEPCDYVRDEYTVQTNGELLQAHIKLQKEYKKCGYKLQKVKDIYNVYDSSR